MPGFCQARAGTIRPYQPDQQTRRGPAVLNRIRILALALITSLASLAGDRGGRRDTDAARRQSVGLQPAGRRWPPSARQGCRASSNIQPDRSATARRWSGQHRSAKVPRRSPSTRPRTRSTSPTATTTAAPTWLGDTVSVIDAPPLQCPRPLATVTGPWPTITVGSGTPADQPSGSRSTRSPTRSM